MQRAKEILISIELYTTANAPVRQKITVIKHENYHKLTSKEEMEESYHFILIINISKLQRPFFCGRWAGTSRGQHSSKHATETDKIFIKFNFNFILKAFNILSPKFNKIYFFSVANTVAFTLY